MERHGLRDYQFAGSRIWSRTASARSAEIASWQSFRRCSDPEVPGRLGVIYRNILAAGATRQKRFSRWAVSGVWESFFKGLAISMLAPIEIWPGAMQFAQAP